MGSGKTKGTSSKTVAKNRAVPDRRDYDPLQEAKNPSPPGRRKQSAGRRRKSSAQ